jgi:hypothetical protein
MMERRESFRKLLDFEEFPVRAEFFSGIEYSFHGHIRNISSGGLCVVMLNCKQASPPGTKGVLTLRYKEKSVDILATVKWIDVPGHMLKYVGIETDAVILEEKIRDVMFED